MKNQRKGRAANLPDNTPEARLKAAAIREALLTDLATDPSQDLKRLAARHGASYALAYKLRRAIGGANANQDSSEEWGQLLKRDIPLKLRSRTMRDIIKSNNPVAAARMLEIVLDADGLRKKASEPKRESVIVVQASDDVTFE